MSKRNEPLTVGDRIRVKFHGGEVRDAEIVHIGSPSQGWHMVTVEYGFVRAYLAMSENEVLR